MTPADFVEMARIDSARRLLEDTDKPLQGWHRVAALQTLTPCIAAS
jgi:transcriptional regulator GlxA family with amidase domain